jgi:hypothetical protein
MRELAALIRRHDLRGAVVRLFVEVTPENETQLNDAAIREILRGADVYHLAGVRREVVRADRARLGANPEGLTDAELLERYLLAREVGADRRAALLERAQAIFDAVTEDGG